MLAKGLICIAYNNFCQEGKRTASSAFLEAETGGFAGTTDH